jgi:hypothetical protein
MRYLQRLWLNQNYLTIQERTFLSGIRLEVSKSSTQGTLAQRIGLLLDDIHELRAVLDGSPEVHEAQELIESEASASGREPIFGSSNNYSMQQIISQYLPSRVEVDRFLSIYFRERPSFFLSFIQSTSNVNIEIFGPTLKKSTLFGFPFCFPSAIWRL